MIYFISYIHLVVKLIEFLFRTYNLDHKNQIEKMCNFIKIFSFVLIHFLISSVFCSPVINNISSIPLLLLISFDGFRWDYPDLYHLPNFYSLMKRGVRAKYIQNNFATVTFPLHFTMVTGLYEETHGIVANTIYDPILKAIATLDTMNDTKWWYVIVIEINTSMDSFSFDLNLKNNS